MNVKRGASILLTATTALTFGACKDKSAHDDPSTTSSDIAGSTSAGFVVVEPRRSDGDVKTILRDEAAKATKRGLKPVAELRAGWCQPCVALEKSMGDARMKEAFAGTYVIRFDVDAWGKSLAEGELDGSAIPIFYLLAPDGKPTGKTIDGGAWGENIPKNMAPPLKAFFHD